MSTKSTAAAPMASTAVGIVAGDNSPVILRPETQPQDDAYERPKRQRTSSCKKMESAIVLSVEPTTESLHVDGLPRTGEQNCQKQTLKESDTSLPNGSSFLVCKASDFLDWSCHHFDSTDFDFDHFEQRPTSISCRIAKILCEYLI